MPGSPLVGPAVNWIVGDDILNLPRVQTAIRTSTASTVPTPFQVTLADESAALASEVLYRLSGRQFTGDSGPVTVRPVSRPVDIDSRAFSGLVGLAGFGLGGYSSSWGLCSSGGVASHYGCSNPPEVDLGAYPVTNIVKVQIDGVTIPPAEYELRDFRRLVRLRPVPPGSPTQRWGWPTCQVDDQPLGQPGTFGVTFTFGMPPPLGAIRAVKVLAQEIWLSGNGDPHRLPARATSSSKQGITVQLNDLTAWLQRRRTGIVEVDLWLSSLEQNSPGVWSPHVGRPRRVPST